mgnify:CR=1 FL=1
MIKALNKTPFKRTRRGTRLIKKSDRYPMASDQTAFR